MYTVWKVRDALRIEGGRIDDDVVVGPGNGQRLAGKNDWSPVVRVEPLPSCGSRSM